MKDISELAVEGALFDGRYKLLRPLSSDGGTADVWLALDTNTIDEIFDDEDDKITAVEGSGIQVAIKIYRPKNAMDLGDQRFRDEFKIVFNCHHTNLVQPINFSIYKGIPYLVLPFCKNGSSERLLGKIQDKDELWKYISDVSAGLAYLHAFSPTIVHHDVKPANVLVDDNGNFSITDFGISSHRGLNREGYDEPQSGTMAYMAPERFDDSYESIPESDIWSFGATLYELVTGKVPFGEDGGLAQLQFNAVPPEIEKPVPADIKKLIQECLSQDISKRPSAEYIYKAASVKEYPIKNKLKYWLLTGGVLFIAVIVLILMLMGHHNSSGLANEELYEQAMTLIGSGEKEDLQAGIAILDTLVNRDYVPAIYEEAFTYGWDSDSASVARKALLGIEIYPEKSVAGWMPKSDNINIKAINLLTKIEELNNPEYPEINAKALYKKAVYYFNVNEMFGKKPEDAETLMVRALVWANQCGDEKLKDKINRNLEVIKQNK